jgi:hypothetical protein
MGMSIPSMIAVPMVFAKDYSFEVARKLRNRRSRQSMSILQDCIFRASLDAIEKLTKQSQAN